MFYETATKVRPLQSSVITQNLSPYCQIQSIATQDSLLCPIPILCASESFLPLLISGNYYIACYQIQYSSNNCAQQSCSSDLWFRTYSNSLQLNKNVETYYNVHLLKYLNCFQLNVKKKTQFHIFHPLSGLSVISYLNHIWCFSAYLSN